MEQPRYRREGFAGQRLRVVPRSIIAAALRAPITSQLLVTDCGHFPHASAHRRVRPNGAGQTVVIVCSQGSGWAEVDGVRHRIGPRQALLVPRRAPHAYGADPDDPWTIWWLHLAGEQAAELAAATRATRQRPVIPVAALTRCTGLIDEVIDHLEQDETLARLRAASGAAWHLLTTLAEPRAGEDGGDPVDRIRERLAADLDQPLSIAEVAAEVNLSPSHLTARFKARTGYAPMRYRTLLRMQRARELLDTSDKPVATIAREVGYDDAAHFSRRFSSLHQVSPRAYRNTGKG
ncbi:MAG: AraC family transcriptional regulator [Propionicimonas sp.]